jgi:DNA (cytosine-5)-methyltransferase 3A
MRVLSLFDGISCARVALTQAGVHVDAYYASEVDPKAIQVAMKNYPDTIQLGDVRNLSDPPSPIDLLIGGSPCQDLSIAKKNREGLAGTRSSLFWEYVRIYRLVKPRWFILENVASMPSADRDIITQELQVEPVLFDAALVSAQSRKRLFWTNIRFQLPADQGILLRNILQSDAEVDESMTMNGKSFCLTATYHKTGEGQNEYEHNKARKQRTMVLTTEKAEKAKGKNKFIQIGYVGAANHCKVGGQAMRIYSTEGKSTTSGVGLYDTERRIRKLTPIECERLQGLPDNYTEGVAKTHRYKCLGNGFCVPVVAHILAAL